MRIVLPSPDRGEGHITPAKQFDGLSEQPAADPLRPKSGVDIDLSDLGLQSGAGIEQHTPAEAHDFARYARRQDDVLATEARPRRIGDLTLDLVRRQLWMVIVALFVEHELAQQRPNQVEVRLVELGNLDLGRGRSRYDLPADGTPSSTLRKAWAAPSRPAVSTGTTSLAFSLVANLDSVSS